MKGRIAVTFEGVSKRFGDHAVLENISCTLTGGRIVAITGRNGSGKSTFLRLAGHLLRPSEGRVVVEETALPSPTSLSGGHLPQSGRQVNGLTRDGLRCRIGLLSPELALSPELTGLENLDFLAGLRGRTLADDEKAALLQRVGLAPEDARKRARACSTGQRQRLALAVLIASSADLWLLDEPGANLDDAGKDVVQREARTAAKRGALVLVATNDANEAAWADNVLALGNAPLMQQQAVAGSTTTQAPPLRGGRAACGRGSGEGRNKLAQRFYGRRHESFLCHHPSSSPRARLGPAFPLFPCGHGALRRHGAPRAFDGPRRHDARAGAAFGDALGALVLCELHGARRDVCG